MLKQEPLDDKRGKHDNHNKIAPDVYALAMDYLKSIPHKPSHYTYVKSNRLYFENPALSIKIIYNLFQDYYKEKSGIKLKMQYKTYFKFFRQTNFDFKKPKTDTCDFCRECEVKLGQNPNDACHVEYNIHKRKVDAYLKMKNDFIRDAKEGGEVLVIEFDYAQNFPLPKLTVTSQFYKRLLWLYLFCVHVHNDDAAFMYTFLESKCKKGANTVASFVFDCVNKKIQDFPNTKKVILLSDAAGGQNKNQTLLRFCTWLAKTFNVEVLHLFPVRGHSFGQCDRNFGIIRNSMKKLETVEVPDTYLERIESSRQNPSPFLLVNDQSIVFDWDKALVPYFEKKPKSKNNIFKIQKYCILKYKPCGMLLVSSSYHMILNPFKYAKNIPAELTLEPAPKGSLKPSKIKDIEDLFVYLKEESRECYKKLFEEHGSDNPNVVGENENVTDDE